MSTELSFDSWLSKKAYDIGATLSGALDTAKSHMPDSGDLNSAKDFALDHKAEIGGALTGTIGSLLAAKKVKSKITAARYKKPTLKQKLSKGLSKAKNLASSTKNIVKARVAAKTGKKVR